MQQKAVDMQHEDDADTDKDARGRHTSIANVVDVVSSGKEATRILKAVNLERDAEDPIDKVIIDRIM